MKLLKLGIGSIKKVVKNMILFEPVLEAKRKPTPSKPIKIKPNKDEMDYTDEVDNGDIDEANDDDNSEDNQDDDMTDYTDEEMDVDPDDDGPTNDDDNSSDYTEEVQNDEDNDSTAGDQQEDPDQSDESDDENTDYSDMGDDQENGDTNNSDDSSSDDNSNVDDSNGDGNDNTEDNADNDKNGLILQDFINLYYLSKASIKKLSNVDKTDIFINKIVTQVSTNFTTLQKQLFDYITFRFSKNKYVNNLYQYNYFLEAFKINVEMLKKTSIFITNS
jgi:hypothetical protein